MICPGYQLPGLQFAGPGHSLAWPLEATPPQLQISAPQPCDMGLGSASHMWGEKTNLPQAVLIMKRGDTCKVPCTQSALNKCCCHSPWPYLYNSLKLWVRRGCLPRGQRGLPSRPTFCGLLPGRDLLQFDEVLAEVMFLPLFVTEALQKCCRGGVGRAGREVKVGRERSSPGGFPTPRTSLPSSRGLSGALASSKDTNQP